LPGLSWHDLLSDRQLPLDTQGEIPLEVLLQHWPVALCATGDALHGRRHLPVN